MTDAEQKIMNVMSTNKGLLIYEITELVKLNRAIVLTAIQNLSNKKFIQRNGKFRLELTCMGREVLR